MDPAGLSSTDRLLPVWIGLAMGVGLGLGALIPASEHAKVLVTELDGGGA